MEVIKDGVRKRYESISGDRKFFLDAASQTLISKFDNISEREKMAEALEHLSAQIEKAQVQFERQVEDYPRHVAAVVRPHLPQLADGIEKIHIDSPLIISFCLICFIIQLARSVFGLQLALQYFGIPSLRLFDFYSPLSYVRIFTQVLGHTSWAHLSGNMTHILLVGPACEREFGMYNLLRIMGWTAAASAVAHMLFGPANGIQIGASGVVFMLILLNSLIEARIGRLPLTFVVQVALWCSKEVSAQFFSNDQVSHVGHLTGAIVGTVAGYHLHVEKVHDKVQRIGLNWLRKAKVK